MPLNPPVKSGLRPLHNGSKQPAKVNVVVAPGDTVEVSDDVAAQLQAATTAFKDGAAPAALLEALAEGAELRGRESSVAEEAPPEDKPKRGRRTKAQPNGERTTDAKEVR